jgi:hypothetical protein
MPRSKKSTFSNSLHENYGGFHDLTTFRAETGLTNADITDVDALQVINEDIREQKRISDKERSEFETKAREADQLRQARDSAMSQKNYLESNLELEKSKRRLYEDALNPYRLTRGLEVYSVNNFLEKERLKRDVKRELEEEKRQRADALRWKRDIENYGKPKRTKSKSKRSKSRSKSKRSKSKSKKK